MLDRILLLKTCNYFITNNLINNNNSVTNQLIYLVDSINSSLDINLYVRSVFLCMSKEIFWHEGLLFKLKQNGLMVNLPKGSESE